MWALRALVWEFRRFLHFHSWLESGNESHGFAANLWLIIYRTRAYVCISDYRVVYASKGRFLWRLNCHVPKFIINTLVVSLEIQPLPEKLWSVQKTVVTSSVCGLLVTVIISVTAAVYVGIARKNRRRMNGKVKTC